METITTKPAHPDSALIDAMGGTGEVARLCRIKGPSVSEWRRNGIPPARRDFFRLLRPDLFQPEPPHGG